MKNKLALKLIFGVVISVSMMLSTLEAALSGSEARTAAESFDKAGNYSQAAENYIAAGNEYFDTEHLLTAAAMYKKAAEAYENGKMYAEAAQMYIETSRTHMLIASDYRSGDYYIRAYTLEQRKGMEEHERKLAQELQQKAAEMKAKVSGPKEL